MATGKALDGKPYAGNPHVRFDEGEVASCTAEASLRRVHCRRQPEAMTRPQVASRSEVARGLCASVCAATPRRGSLLYSMRKLTGKAAILAAAICMAVALPTFAEVTVVTAGENVSVTDATACRFKHYRFKIDDGIGSSRNSIQISEFRLLCNGVDVTSLRSGFSYGSGAGDHSGNVPGNALDEAGMFTSTVLKSTVVHS